MTDDELGYEHCINIGWNVMTRMLVVDRSELLAWVINKLTPEDVEIERASTFAQAMRALTTAPPDAAFFNLVPCHPMWRSLIDECVGNERLIPFLCTGELDHYEVCNCSLPCRMEDFVSRETATAEFADRIATLIQESREPDPERFRRGRERWSTEPALENRPRIRKV